MTRLSLAFALAFAVAPAVAESATSGVWTYSFEIAAPGKGFATALSPSPGADPNDPSYMIARCMSGRTEFLVGGAGGWGLSGRKLEVTAQVLGGAAVTVPWDVSSNGKAVFLDDKVEEFLRMLPDDGKVRISVMDGTRTPRENIFSTTGFGQVRARIAEACGWTP